MAAANAGVNVNDIIDHANVDALTGTARINGVAVSVRRAPQAAAA